MPQENFFMLSAAINQLALAAVEKHAADGTPLDRESLTARAEGIWREHGQAILDELAPDFELTADAKLLAAMEGEFTQVYVQARVDTGPRGSHTPLSVTWQPARAKAASLWIPPVAIKKSNYVVAWEPSTKSFLYAINNDYHQFGHAWRFDGVKWSEVSKHAHRAGSAAQSFAGGYDAGRGGIVAWNVDDGRPYGVLVKSDGVSVLHYSEERAKAYGQDPIAVIETANTPEVDSEDWSDVSALFGYDERRGVWVMLTQSAVFELDQKNVWSKVAKVESGVLPDSVDGGRDHGSGDGAGAVWDAKRSQVIFWFVEDETFKLVTWDGRVLSPLVADGLPDELMSPYGSPKVGSLVASHPELGVVVYGGAKLGLFALEGGSWQAKPMGESPPPGSFGASLAFAPNGDAMIGPGKFIPEGDDDESEDDDDDELPSGLFYVRQNGKWSQQGAMTVASPFAKLRGNMGWPMLACAQGAVFATSPRESLQTLQYDPNRGWQSRVVAEAGERVFVEGAGEGALRRGLAAGLSGALTAIASNGAVFELGNDGWAVRSPASDTFAVRRSFDVVCDVAGKRLVVWGGDRGNQNRVNDTLVWSNGAWRELPPSPRPSDYRTSGGAELELAYDSALGAVVRIGFTEVSVLEGDRWRRFEARALREFMTPHRRVVCHDEKTRETLIVSLETGKIARFDLERPDLVGNIAEAVGVRPGDVIFEPASRKLYAFADAEDKVIDLGPVFELAATLGPRVTALPPAGPEPMRLYKQNGERIEAYFADVVGTSLRARRGALGSKLSETTIDGDIVKLEEELRRQGYVSAEALESEQVRRALAKPVWYLAVADEPVKKGTFTSRLGGGPSGLPVKEWPRDDEDKPLGFLGQIALPKEHGGGAVALFVKTDGTTTEDDDNNVAIRLTDEQLASAQTDAPKGTRLAKIRPIRVGERTLELGKGLVDALSGEDGALARLLDTLTVEVDSDDEDEDSDDTIEAGFSKIGGYATFIQEGPTDAEVLVQIDFDGISIDDKGWDEVGLMGGLYVFTSDDGELSASWQYT